MGMNGHSNKDSIKPNTQMELFDFRPSIVHYWDRDEALHSGRIVRKIKRGKKKGQYVVVDSKGKRFIPQKIRNIEQKI
jgi:hypothetical protein